MSRPAGNPLVPGPQLVRRVARLFRIERAGLLHRCPAATARRLIARRGALIDMLIAADKRSRAAGETAASPFDEVLRELAAEIGRCRSAAERRLTHLAAELQARRGDVPHTGLRRGTGGRFLGRG